jgi:hypothetical protein
MTPKDSIRPVLNPSGLCQCGCGEPAPIAKRTNVYYGHVAGEPLRFLPGHQRRGEHFNDTPPNPGGLCQCGCGESVQRSLHTDSKKGTVRGEFVRFLTGHHSRISPLEYIEEDRGYDTPCHIWQRAINKRWGYGITEGRRAHVVAWEAVNGPVPDGMDLDHLCRVRACRNPEHLEPVIRAVNIQRGDKAKLTPEIVREIRARAQKRNLSVLAVEYGVHPSTIRAVAHRRTWQNIE